MPDKKIPDYEDIVPLSPGQLILMADKVEQKYTSFPIEELMLLGYGVEWDPVADTYTRLGRLASFVASDTIPEALLPLWAGMKRCILNDAGEVKYYLESDDSYNKEDVAPSVNGTADSDVLNKLHDTGAFTEAESEYKGRYAHNTDADTYAIITGKDSNDQLALAADIFPNGNENYEICTAVLNGDDGQIQVEIPEHWWLFEVVSGKPRWWVSEIPRAGWQHFKKSYIGAYPGILYDISAGNYIDGDGSGTQYEAGDKLGSISGEKPISNEIRAIFRTIAEARGTGWHQLDNRILSAVQRLYLIEYANFNIQSEISEGNTKFTSWDFATCIAATGKSNKDGNGSGGQSTTNGNSGDYISYRGIEDIFGNLWQFADGINIHNSSANGSRLYLCDDPTNYANDTETNYNLAGNLAEADGYIKTLIQSLLPLSGFYPKTVGGSSTTYICDYYYTSYDTAPDDGWHVVRVGGDAHYAVNAGVFCVSSDAASSIAASTIGARLCFFNNS